MGRLHHEQILRPKGCQRQLQPALGCRSRYSKLNPSHFISRATLYFLGYVLFQFTMSIPFCFVYQRIRHSPLYYTPVTVFPFVSLSATLLIAGVLYVRHSVSYQKNLHITVVDLLDYVTLRIKPFHYGPILSIGFDFVS